MARLHRDPGGIVDTVSMADPDRQASGSTTIQRQMDDTPVTLYVYQPFGPFWLHGHGPGGAWAEALSSEYSVAFHHLQRGGRVLAGVRQNGRRTGRIQLAQRLRRDA